MEGGERVNQKEVFAALESTFGQNRTLVVPMILVELLDGNIVTALLLSQLIYWSSRATREDGYIYKTYDDWREEIGITPKQARTAKNKLENLDLIETKVIKAHGSPTVHYKVKKDRLYDWMGISGQTDMPLGADGHAPEGRSLTEITTEITTDKELPERKPNLVWDVAVNLGILTGMDIKLKTNKGRLLKSAKQLIEADYSAADILEFRTWWYKSDWRGKRGQAPTLAQISELLKQALDSTQSIVPPPTYDGELKNFSEEQLDKWKT